MRQWRRPRNLHPHWVRPLSSGDGHEFPPRGLALGGGFVTQAAPAPGTCSTCGIVKAYLGSTLLKTINTSSASTHYKVVIDVAAVFPSASGTLKLLQPSAGEPVSIDGVAVSLE